jgi:hypothetical protein
LLFLGQSHQDGVDRCDVEATVFEVELPDKCRMLIAKKMRWRVNSQYRTIAKSAGRAGAAEP